ncbi:Trimeric autotransporter adhesin [Candidatus Nanohalococcus occultus]|uniref:Trimeric autotransporter adhesin n=2 Tax=Candidatus Nanohalococcus occultus TaxID=2978047 RepID=A0ABY8CH28_9ARCH|nr:Trimeric autotransporter adhesin [Candidatus Nanohaloarchaeota archaeon SVXNc]
MRVMKKTKLLVVSVLVFTASASAIDFNDTESLDYWSDNTLDFRVNPDGTVQAQNNINLNGNTLQNANLEAGSVDEGEINQNTLDDSEIEDNSLTESSLAADSVGSSELMDNSVSNSEIQNTASFTFDGITNNGDLDMSGNDIVGASSLQTVGTNAEKRYDYSYDQGSDESTYYHYLGEASDQSGMLYVTGSIGGHEESQGKAYIELIVNSRGQQVITGRVNGQLGTSADIVAYNDADSNTDIYLKTDKWAQIQLTYGKTGSSSLNTAPSPDTTAPSGTLQYNLSQDVENQVDYSGNLDLNGNTLEDVGGLQNCNSNEFLNGNGECETDTDTDTDNQDLSEVLAQGNSAGSYSINMNSNGLADVASIDGGGDAVQVTDSLSLNNNNLDDVNRILMADAGPDGKLGFNGAEIYEAPLDDSDSPGMLQLVNDGGIAFEPSSDGTTAATFTTSNNLNMRSNNIVNTNQIDGVDIDNPGNALTLSGDQYAVASGSIDDNEIADNTVDNSEIQNSDNFAMNQLDVNGVSGSASTDGGTGIGAPAVYTSIIEARNEKGGQSTYLELGADGYHGSIGNDDIGFVTQGNVQAMVSDQGNFGIGTTSPSDPLDVNGDATIRGDLDVFGSITNTNVSDLSVNGSILPPEGYSSTFDVGSSSREWRDGYFSGTVYASNFQDAGTGDSISDTYVDESGDTMTGDLDLSDNQLRNLDLQNVNGIEMDGDIYGSGIDIGLREVGSIVGPKNGDTDLNLRTQGDGTHVVSVEDGSTAGNIDIMRFNEGTQEVDVPNGNLDLNGNSLMDIGGLQNCGANEFVNGNGNCVTDTDTDTQDLANVLSQGNSAGSNNIDLNENQLRNVDSIQDGSGIDTIRLDGSNNIVVPNGQINVNNQGEAAVFGTGDHAKHYVRFRGDSGFGSTVGYTDSIGNGATLIQSGDGKQVAIAVDNGTFGGGTNALVADPNGDVNIPSGDLNMNSNTLQNVNLEAGSVDESEIAQNTLDDSEIEDNSLTSVSLAAGSVGDSEIQDNTVDNSEIENSASFTFGGVTTQNGDVTINGPTESPINAGPFSQNTKQNTISFSAAGGSNDPGYITHETNGDQGNTGVLHLAPSDDNAFRDYVAIHGTDDPASLKLHTDGSITGISGLNGCGGNEFVNGNGNCETDTDTDTDNQDLANVLSQGNSAGGNSLDMNYNSIDNVGNLNVSTSGSQIAEFSDTGITLSQPLSVESSGPLSVANGLDLTGTSTNTIDSYSNMYLTTSSGSPSDIVLDPTGTVGIDANASIVGDLDMQGGTVENANLEAGSVDESEIAQNTLDDSEIEDNSLTAGSISANTMGNGVINNADSFTFGGVTTNGNLDVNENSITGVDDLQDGSGTSTVSFDGSNNVDIPNGNLRLADGGKIETSSADNRQILFKQNGDGVSLETSGSGSGYIRWYDKNAGQEIIRGDEGGDVQIPNGNLNVNGQLSVGSTECNTGQYLDGDGTCTSVTGETSGEYVDEAGDTMSGDLDMNSNKILNIGSGNIDFDPSGAGDINLRGNEIKNGNIVQADNLIAGSYSTGTSKVDGNDIYVQDDVEVGGDFVGAGADVAEKIQNESRLEPGTVVQISGNMSIDATDGKHDTDVAGVVSTDPAMIMAKERGGVPVAMTGTVPVKVTVENGNIMPGDMLTTSSENGKAMKCGDMENCEGSVIGKAMQPAMEDSKIKMLISMS